MYDPAKVSQAFDKLFRTYPSFQAGKGAEAALRVYFEAVEPYATGDILDAVANFITGRAPGVNPSFAPPAPAVASECRRVMNMRLDSERRSRPVLSLPEPVIDEAERERVGAGLKSLIADMTANLSPEEEKAAAANRGQWAKVNQRFSPDQSEEAIAARLGFTVGDIEGDRDVA